LLILIRVHPRKSAANSNLTQVASPFVYSTLTIYDP
jgi:hypothetical protein